MRTTDNNNGKDIKELSIAESRKEDIQNLRIIANKKISDIKPENYPDLFVFPPYDHGHGDEIAKGTIFSLNDTNIKTNNIMGFVGVNDTRLTITSRFAKDDTNDYFLHYMLQKVLSINIVHLDQSKRKESLWNFLPYLFPYYLKRALSQGIYRSYQTIKSNDLNVKGVIDIKRHINRNNPFSGRIAYINRIYSTCNDVIKLIRHTIEKINSNKLTSHVLKSDRETIGAVQQIISSTGYFNKNDCNKIINRNRKSLRHPYFNKYRDLQKLCMLILRHEKLSYGDEKDKIYGLLFDGAWLWEEYLGKILHDKFIHPQNRTGSHQDFLFQDEKNNNFQKIYPDFIKKTEPIIIADAKYKFLNYSGYEEDYGSSDYYQILAYMFRYSSKLGYLFFPYNKSYGQSIFKKLYKIKDTGASLTILGLPIPQNSENFAMFIQQIKECESKFIREIN